MLCCFNVVWMQYVMRITIENENVYYILQLKDTKQF